MEQTRHLVRSRASRFVFAGGAPVDSGNADKRPATRCPPALTIADRASSTTFERIGAAFSTTTALRFFSLVTSRMDGFDVERRRPARHHDQVRDLATGSADGAVSSTVRS
jgi:hypothetical protein